ncbi:root meristem growth factor 2 [Eutrema salsugineum]|uniref:root meristem growth factor 2 n=1 Tax=Eutrema salsugineum TaxID=72664 RepID=UPI000CED3BD5|nr:root meristem growth factor 2 [Eutrema salsugineum]
MAITSSFLCMLVLLLFCLSCGYSLHGNEKSSVDVISNTKVMKHVDDDVATKKVQVRGRSKEEFSKERNKMKTNSKKPTNKETSVEDEDDFVAYTADYWKPRHHPPKNN